MRPSFRCFQALAILSFVLATQAGPGILNFSNYRPHFGIDAPVYDVDCQTPLGSSFLGQLYAGPALDSLAPVGTATAFKEVNGKGTGYVIGGAVVINSVEAGQVAYVQLRAWDASGGYNTEGLPPPPTKFGHSKIIQVVLGGDRGDGMPPVVPPDLVGLESFCLVPRPPTITQEPADGVVLPGQTYRFEVMVRSAQPVTYQWRFNGADIPGATSSRYVIPSVSANNLGTYQVSVGSAGGSTLSREARLSFRTPPPGATVWFSNQTPGLDAPVYDVNCTTRLAGPGFVAQLWAGPAEDQLAPASPALPFGNGSQTGYWQIDDPWLVLTNVAPGATAFVQVRAWELVAGETYAEAAAAGAKHGESPVLQVVAGGAGAPPAFPVVLAGLQSFCLMEAPAIVGQPVGAVVPLGYPFSLTVDATSATPMTYQWRLNGQDIAGATEATLSIAAAEATHAGAYSVVVSNAAGSRLSAEAWIQIREFPAGALIYFSNLVPPAGVDAPVLDAETGSRLEGPAYRAQLYAGPTPELLAPVGWPQPFQTGSSAGYWETSEDSWLNLPTVVPGATAYAQVKVWESRGGWHFEEAVAAGAKAGASEVLAMVTGGGDPAVLWPTLRGLPSFFISHAPVFTQQPASATVTAGTTVTFEAQTSPAVWATNQWYFNGQPIAGAHSATLVVANAQLADEGEYVLVAQNGAGSVASEPAYLTVTDPSRGTVNFRNLAPIAGIDAPVFESDGVTRAQAESLRAQLWGGPDADQLKPAGEPAWFRTGAGAGYWTSANSLRTLPNVLAGAVATVQVRVWDAAVASDFETAVAAGAKYGVSAAFTVKTGGDGAPPSLPADLAGLQSFALEPALTITNQPAAGLFFVGEPVALEVGASGSGALTFQWLKNGQPLASATAARFELAAAKLEDAGWYSVEVRDGRRAVASPPVVVGVMAVPDGAGLVFSNHDPGADLDAPVFDVDGTTRLAGAGFVAQLWAGATAETLAPISEPVPFLSGGDAGYWESGWQSSVTIPGLAAGAPTVVQVRVWEVATGAGFEAARAAGGRVGVSPIFEVTTGGAGAATAWPTALSGLTSFRLSQLPVITSAPGSLGVVQKREATLSVEVSSPDLVTFQWYRNGEAIPGATADKLRLAAVTPADAGQYTVTVSNWVGEVTSEPATLAVLTPTSGGEILFRTSYSVGALIFNDDGKTRLAGSRYVGQLWVGTTPEGLKPVSTAVVFGSGTGAGYLYGPVVRLTNVPPDITVYVQVHAWDTRFGRDYASAVAVGRAGTSEVFSVVTGGLGVAPATLAGMKSFSLAQPEPPLILRQPADYYWVIEGTMIYFDVVATNFVSVSWERQTAEGWVSVVGANTTRLEFVTATAQDAGDFRAVLSGVSGVSVLSAPATLAVGRRLQAGATDGGFSLKVTPGNGPVFVIEGSTNLTQWQALDRVTNETAVIELAEAPDAGQQPTRFYRARDAGTGQVASDNIAGFVEVELLPGFTMMGLPLLAPSYKTADLFAGMPEWTEVYKYYPDGRGFTINTLFDGTWTVSEETLAPGEGALVLNQTDDVYYLTLRGDVATGEIHQALPAKWSLQTAMVPLTGQLDRDFGCPFEQLEIVGRMDAWSATIMLSVFADGGWALGPTPVVQPGEAFWIWKNAATDWSFTFNPPR